MEVMFGVLFMISGAAVGSLYQDPAVCTFILNKNDSCYVALGRRLHLNPPQNNLKNPDFKLTKTFKSSSLIILDYKNALYDPTVSVTGWRFINNNYTVIINHTEKNDSATYKVEITDEYGKTVEASLHLNIEAPVSSVSVTESCLSITERTVYCRADGDELQYNWTGASHQHQVENQNQTLRLDKNFTGSVTCHVKNHVSSETKDITLQPCPGTTTTTTSTAGPSTGLNGRKSTVKKTEPLGQTRTTTKAPGKPFLTLQTSLIVMSGLMLLLMGILITAVLMYRRRHAAKKKDSSQGGEELVYSQVSHHPSQTRNNTPLVQEEGVEYATVATRPSRKKLRQMEDDVQYGELVFNTPAKDKPKKMKEQVEDCVYSQVRQGR